MATLIEAESGPSRILRKHSLRYELLDALVLLRLPFSVLLAPVFLFSASQLPSHDWPRLVAVFVILHLFLYPATNAYNSYHDRDEGSIGGLKRPPRVNRWVQPLAWSVFVLGLAWSLLLSMIFAAGVALYFLVGVAYSHRRIRLKRYPFLSFAVVSLFQGWYTYALVWQGAGGGDWSPERLHIPGLIATLFLAGFYPITQVYQHEEDRRRGDTTLSMLLGYRGTFVFTGICFAIGTAGMLWWLKARGMPGMGWLFLATLAPAALFFGSRFLRMARREELPDYRLAMALTVRGTVGLNLFMLLLLLRGTA